MAEVRKRVTLSRIEKIIKNNGTWGDVAKELDFKNWKEAREFTQKGCHKPKGKNGLTCSFIQLDRRAKKNDKK